MVSPRNRERRKLLASELLLEKGADYVIVCSQHNEAALPVCKTRPTCSLLQVSEEEFFAQPKA